MGINKDAAKTQIGRSGRTMKMNRAAQELRVAGETSQQTTGVFRYPGGAKLAALKKLSQLVLKE